MSVHIIIPARYASTRFPGKLAALLGGKPVLQWVYEAALQVSEAEAVYIAAADDRIVALARQFGAKVFLSKVEHHSGTERCAEAAVALGLDQSIVINIQGDEPFVCSRQISALLQALKGGADIASLCYPLKDPKLLDSPHCVKVVMDETYKAMYFSRAPIPYSRDACGAVECLPKGIYFKHIGMYAFAPNVLLRVASLRETSLERVERLEQLRWLQHGFSIQMVESEVDTIGIDTPEDLERAARLI